jgi:hypothetical protein
MRWLVQDSVNFGALENNVKPLVEALRKMGKQIDFVGLVPEERKITGLPLWHNDGQTILYGSTMLAEIGAGLGFTPGVFYEHRWFDPHWCKYKRDDLLNNQMTVETILDLRTRWIERPVFIKPVDPKLFTGQVIEPEERQSWLQEHAHLSWQKTVCVSPIQQIDREWRFFIIDGKVITGSLYKRDGCKVTREPISKEVWYQAELMSEKWLPSKNIVMDICQCRSGEFKVVEFNCVNSSGFYNCDISAIITAIDSLRS